MDLSIKRERLQSLVDSDPITRSKFTTVGKASDSELFSFFSFLIIDSELFFFSLQIYDHRFKILFKICDPIFETLFLITLTFLIGIFTKVFKTE
jgi:hypothetical protein